MIRELKQGEIDHIIDLIKKGYMVWIDENGIHWREKEYGK